MVCRESIACVNYLAHCLSGRSLWGKDTTNLDILCVTALHFVGAKRPFFNCIAFVHKCPSVPLSQNNRPSCGFIPPKLYLCIGSLPSHLYKSIHTMKNKKYLLFALIGILVLTLAGLSYLLMAEKQANHELVQEFQLQKEDLENEYSRFVHQYDELKTTIANDSLAQLLEQEQLKTQRLLDELRTVKSSNASEIRRLKQELATLRKVMMSYVNQIDSLNRINTEQRQVIAEVTQKYNEASRQVSTLSAETKSLNKKVELAAQLDVTAIRVEALNKRGRTAKKVKDATKLAIGFTIVKNITAENGERTLYIRISTPDNTVLTKNEGETFAYENRQLAYSIKKYIEYNGEEQAVSVYWDIEEFLHAGNYRVDIFEGGNLIGSAGFTLG